MLDTAAYRRAAEHFRELALLPSTAAVTVSGRYRESARCIDELCDELDDCRETLRDRLAMAALTGLLGEKHYAGGPDEFSHDAYMYADACLAERRKAPEAREDENA